MNDLNCPYCEEPNEVCHDDGQGYEEGEYHQMECSSCRKWFIFSTVVSFDYTSKAANCLNEGEHDWYITTTIPKFATKMQCSQCGEKRNPSNSEKKFYNIPEYKGVKP